MHHPCCRHGNNDQSDHPDRRLLIQVPAQAVAPWVVTGRFGDEIPKFVWVVALCQRGCCHLHHHLPIGRRRVVVEPLIRLRLVLVEPSLRDFA